MTDDNEGTSPDQPAGSEENSEDSELRTDGGQTIASNPTTEGPSTPAEPDGPPSIDEPGIRRSPVDGLIPGEADTEASREGDPTCDSYDRADSVVLQPFQELCGRLEEIQRTDQDVVLTLSSGTLCFPLGSEEARTCIDELEGIEGSQVRILRTPNTAKPLFVALD